jgi:hypothetical protein
MLGSAAAAKVKQVPLSINTMTKRIQGLSCDLRDQLRENFETPEYKRGALQIYESTDISEKAQLLAFIRFVKDEKLLMNTCSAKI